jgi:hypothetical protein
VQEGKDPVTFPNAVSTMALFISEDKDELARMGGPGSVPPPADIGVAQPAERPGEDAHAHDMVGTRAECIDRVRRWKAAGAHAPGTRSIARQTRPLAPTAAASGGGCAPGGAVAK